MIEQKPFLDWGEIIHVRENTPKNEKHLNDNRYHFTGQAAVVLTWLQKGVKVTTAFTSQNLISDLQRRIGDLGEFGKIDIDREYLLKDGGGKSRMLVYFLPANRRKFITKGWIVNAPRTWFSDLYTPPEIIEKVKRSIEKLKK